MLTRTALALVAGLTLAGCGADTQVSSAPGEGSSTVSPSNGDHDASPHPTPRRSRPHTGDAGSLSAAQLLDLATQDLSKSTGVPADQITVVRNDSVTWPDGSLGCPQPGMGYISVLSPGQLIVLEADGTTYEYHSGSRVPPFLCDDPQPPLPAS